MQQPTRHWRTGIAALCVASHLLLLLVPGLGPGTAVAAAPANVEQGIKLYKAARYDEAIQTLRAAVDSRYLVGNDLIQAREYLARSYARTRQPLLAKETFLATLRTNPTYRPNMGRYTPEEVSAFYLASQELESAPGEGPGRYAVAPGADSTGVAPSLASARQLGLEGSGRRSLAGQWWVWALGAAAVTGAVVAVSGGGGGGGPSGPTGPDLPGFPHTP